MNYLAIIMGITTSVSSAIEITSDHVGNVFTDKESVEFQIRVTSDANLSVTDFGGSEIFNAELAAGESTIEVGRLSRNHYTIKVHSEDEVEEARFGVIPSMDDRPQVEDSCIASDLATSWLVEPEQFDSLATLAKLSGLVWIRDRMRWGEIETQRGEWAERTRYDDAADIHIKHGLKVYQVFHNTPAWAQEETESHSFPDDLRDAFNFAAGTARRFAENVIAWEVWNEPDISVFSSELGDSYSALLKTMYLGYKSVDPDLPVLLCSFAMPPSRFTELVFQNDINDYFDIYNYHIYGGWEAHADRALKHIEVMRRHGAERKPIWLTEAGRPITREPGLVELTPEQGRDVANFLPKAIVSSLSAGVDKYFWFIMPYYRERDKMLFGLLREDMTPTAGYCSLSACIYALGKAEYIGRLDVDGIHVHAFIRDDDSTAVAFWTDGEEKVLKVNTDAEEAVLVGLLGAEQEVAVSGGVLEAKASTSVNYLILPVGSLSDVLLVDYIGEEPEINAYDPENVSHVVLRLQFPRELREKKSETYMLPGNSPTKVSIEIYNFGENEFSGKLKFHLPEGYQGMLDDEEINIGPMERIIRKLKLLPGAESDSGPEEIRVDLTDTSGRIKTFILAWIATGTS